MLIVLTMKDIEAIFDAIGGSGKMAEALGIKPSAASEMKRRGSIPVRYWPKLIAICQNRSIPGVSYESLAKLAAVTLSPVAPPTQKVAHDAPG